MTDRVTDDVVFPDAGRFGCPFCGKSCRSQCHTVEHLVNFHPLVRVRGKRIEANMPAYLSGSSRMGWYCWCGLQFPDLYHLGGHINMQGGPAAHILELVLT